jgi:CBS domain-containing protein
MMKKVEVVDVVLCDPITTLFPHKFKSKNLVTASESTSIVDAFTTMLTKRVPCVLVNDRLFSHDQVLIPTKKWNEPISTYAVVLYVDVESLDGKSGDEWS